MPQPDLDNLADAATELIASPDQRAQLAESSELTPLYDALSDRLLTGEETLDPAILDPVERLGRRLWLVAVFLLVVTGVLSAGVLAGALVLT